MSTARLEADDKSVSTAQVEIRSFTRNEKITKAIKILVLFWALAAFAVLIPILHFILVPALFIAGILGVVYSLRLNKVIVELKGLCPVCQKPVSIQNMVIGEKLADRCESCYCSFDIILN